jgi:hypothetical protein
MRIFLILLLFNCSLIHSQQNIVPNSSFESNTNCPPGGGYWSYCSSWNNVNMNPGAGPWGTPDYFTPCGSGGTAPPATFSGTVAAQNGVSFMGLVLYNLPYPQYREYLATQLTCSMQPGSTYTVSFWITNGTGIISPWTIQNFGIHFSSAPLSQSGWALINVVPQLEVTTNIAFSYNDLSKPWRSCLFLCKLFYR